MTVADGLRAYLLENWSTHGVEVQSFGDTSVTLSVPATTDLTELIYDLKETFDADCDLHLGPKSVSIVAHAQHRRGGVVGSVPWAYVVFCCATTVLSAAVSRYWDATMLYATANETAGPE